MSKKKPVNSKKKRSPKRGRPSKAESNKQLKRRGRKNPVREVLQNYNSIQFNAFFNGFDWETLERMEKEIKKIKKQREL